MPEVACMRLGHFCMRGGLYPSTAASTA